MLAILVIVPMLLAGFAALVMRHKRYIKYTAVAASIFSLAIAVALIFNSSKVQALGWFSVAGVSFDLVTYTYSINLLLLLLVCFIAPFIFLYSFGFMYKRNEQARYYFEMSMFSASMMLFAISGNFITLFISWEMLGLFSYLLIGFWTDEEEAVKSARKALTIISIGDVSMLMAIILIWKSYGSFSFSAILAAPFHYEIMLALGLMLVAAFTKAAQFPFHEWLPAAMAGPTPVSAFLHSSTMVKAGVFLLIILYPLFAAAHMLWVILAIGLASVFISISNALAESHIKKILAYSTIEDLGLMLVAIGLHALYAAILLFFVQTFYKALIFMVAGSAMRANDNREDIYRIYAIYKNKLLYASAIIGVAAIAGIFPLAGFFGKFAIDSASTWVFPILLAADLGTSIYIFRWLFVISSKPRSVQDEIPLNISYGLLPKSMLYAGFALAIASAVAGAMYFYLPKIITLSSYAGLLASGLHLPLEINLVEAELATVIIAFGIFVSYNIFKARIWSIEKYKKSRPLYLLFYSSVPFNIFYKYFAIVFDKASLALLDFDRALFSSASNFAKGFMSLGMLLRNSVNGKIWAYTMALALGIAILIFIFL
ncbi:MAG: NADH-quinone oxidoreductase subunit L [Candidatus Micrarchaeia archaeon]